MALSETIQTMKEQLQEICRDLDKSIKGNKSAAQRVRTSTVELAKIAKIYRKESLDAEKSLALKGKKKR
jgi:hypothetical protein